MEQVTLAWVPKCQRTILSSHIGHAKPRRCRCYAQCSGKSTARSTRAHRYKIPLKKSAGPFAPSLRRPFIFVFSAFLRFFGVGSSSSSSLSSPVQQPQPALIAVLDCSESRVVRVAASDDSARLLSATADLLPAAPVAHLGVTYTYHLSAPPAGACTACVAALPQQGQNLVHTGCH